MTAAQKAELKEKGFCKLEKRFSDAEIDAALADIERLVAAQKDNKWVHKAGTFAAHLSRQSDLLKKFVMDPRLVGHLTGPDGLIGPDVRLYWDQAVIKSGPEAEEFPWHQDNGYGETFPEEYYTTWVALCDVPAEKGAIWVVPGSHKKGGVTHKQNAAGHWVGYEGKEGHVVPVKKGEALIFSSLTMHRSSSNTTPEKRSAYIIQYCDAKTVNGKTKESFTDRALLDVAKGGKCVAEKN